MKAQTQVARDTSRRRSTLPSISTAPALPIASSIPFLDHMLIKSRGLVDLDVTATGDIQIDPHRSRTSRLASGAKAVGDARADALGMHTCRPRSVSRRNRFSPAAPTDITFSGVGNSSTCAEFFQGFVNHAMVTLHVDNLRGDNSHHQAETLFKAFGRALRMAVTLDTRLGKVMPSTKGTL
jgi:imidazoleglycerol-phosphate dehydratase